MKPETSKSFEAYSNSPYSSIKHSSYFHVYDRYFSRFIGQEIIFVEIGVLNGGSLFMWREFFGKHARIIGIELNPEAKKWEKDGFEIYIGSQSDPNFWKAFFSEVGQVDVVLDDGGHTFEQQIVTAECCIPNIKSGGLLVTEDVHTSYIGTLVDLRRILLSVTPRTKSTGSIIGLGILPRRKNSKKTFRLSRSLNRS